MNNLKNKLSIRPRDQPPGCSVVVVVVVVVCVVLPVVVTPLEGLKCQKNFLKNFVKKFNSSAHLLLAVVLITVVIIRLETIVRGQAELEVAHNLHRLIILIERKGIEIEITIFWTKFNLKRISSANGVLENKEVKSLARKLFGFSNFFPDFFNPL